VVARRRRRRRRRRQLDSFKTRTPHTQDVGKYKPFPLEHDGTLQIHNNLESRVSYFLKYPITRILLLCC